MIGIFLFLFGSPIAESVIPFSLLFQWGKGYILRVMSLKNSVSQQDQRPPMQLLPIKPFSSKLFQ